METSHHCPHCGATNAPENKLCASCLRPLAEREETAQGPLLNGRYRLLAQVGSGGFGGVYRAVDLSEGQRIVAVKEISLRGLSAQEIIEATDAFNREVRLLSTLRHPNLPRIRDTFTDAEHWYVVMDFIEGETLETYVETYQETHLANKARSGLPLREALAIALQLCEVLDYLHTREPAVIFRDLKPANVMRTPSGQIYLIDFGIARLFSPGKLKDTMPFGSPGYAAPEQYGRSQTTPRADIYSLGAFLHYLLTGHDPAERPFRFAPLPIAEFLELAELDTLIQRMVSTAPEERPASVAQVRAILQRLAEDPDQRERWEFRPLWTPPAPGSGPAPVAAPPVSVTRRRVLTRALKIGGGVVAVAGVVGLCGGVLSLTSRPQGVHGVAVMPPPSPGTARRQFIYKGHTKAITALSWSPDGTMIASGSADGTVQVWRSADGARLYTLSGYTDAVTSVVWASDRTNVIASAGNDDGTAQVWDALRDHRDLIFHGDGRVLALSWQEKSPWIVSGGTDQDIYTWNATTGARGASYRGHKGNVNALLWLSDPNTATPTAAFTQSLPAPTAAFTQFLWAPTAVFTQFLWAPTPTAMPIPSPISTPTPPPVPTLQPTPTPPLAGTPTPAISATPTPVPPSSFTNLVASGGADGTVQIWDAKTGHEIVTYTGHLGAVNSLALIRRQNSLQYYGFLASASDDRTVRVRLLNELVETDSTIIYHGHTGKVNAVTALYQKASRNAVAPYDAPYTPTIASASDDQTVQIWSDSDSYQALITYKEHYAPVKAVAASPVDNRIVSGDSKGLVHLWTVTPPRYQ